MGVAYSKLSDETWKRGAIAVADLRVCKGCAPPGPNSFNFMHFWENLSKLYVGAPPGSWHPLLGEILDLPLYLKFLKLETFQTHHGGWSFETFKWDLKWNVQMRHEMRCAIWNFSTHHRSWLFETFRWDLKWDVLFEISETFNLFIPITRTAYLKLSDETWKRSATWNSWTLKLFKTHHWGLLIWNFQMRLEMRCAIWNLKLFKPIMRAAYLKLSDETWNKIFYLKCLKLETFQTCHGRCLFETFRWDLKKRCYLKFLKFETFQIHHGELVIWNFQIQLEMGCAIWNFWNLKLCSWNYLKLLMCPLRTKTFQLTLNLEVINLVVHRVDICC